MGKASQFSKSQHRNNTYLGFSLSDRADPRQISPATEALRTAAQQRRSRSPRHRLGGHTVCPPPAAQANGTTWWPRSLCSSHLVQLEHEGRWKQTSGRPEYKLVGKLDLRSLQLFRSLFSVLAAGYHHLALGILKLLMLWPHSNPTIRILGEGPRLPTQFLKFLSVNQAAKIKTTCLKHY